MCQVRAPWSETEKTNSLRFETLIPFLLLKTIPNLLIVSKMFYFHFRFPAFAVTNHLAHEAIHIYMQQSLFVKPPTPFQRSIGMGINGMAEE